MQCGARDSAAIASSARSLLCRDGPVYRYDEPAPLLRGA